jgi:hypothetical protein
MSLVFDADACAEAARERQEVSERGEGAKLSEAFYAMSQRPCAVQPVSSDSMRLDTRPIAAADCIRSSRHARTWTLDKRFDLSHLAGNTRGVIEHSMYAGRQVGNGRESELILRAERSRMKSRRVVAE